MELCAVGRASKFGKSAITASGQNDNGCVFSMNHGNSRLLFWQIAWFWSSVTSDTSQAIQELRKRIRGRQLHAHDILTDLRRQFRRSSVGKRKMKYSLPWPEYRYVPGQQSDMSKALLASIVKPSFRIAVPSILRHSWLVLMREGSTYMQSMLRTT